MYEVVNAAEIVYADFSQGCLDILRNVLDSKCLRTHDARAWNSPLWNAILHDGNSLYTCTQ